MNLANSTLILAVLGLLALAAVSGSWDAPLVPSTAARGSRMNTESVGAACTAVPAKCSRGAGDGARARAGAEAPRRAVPEADAAVVDLALPPAEWSGERTDSLRAEFATLPAASILHLLRVRAAGVALGGWSLRELQDALALRVLEDAAERAEVVRELRTGRVGRAGAAWVRGALAPTR